MLSVPFHSLEPQHRQVGSKLQKAFEQVLEGNSFVLGKNLKDFEDRFARLCGCRFCAGVGNGLDAITLSLRALGIGQGDDVIVPANTFIATWLAVSATGARPVAVEPDEQTYNIDPAKIASSVTQHTRAIIPVHLFGQACDMTTILKVSRERKLFVVEDNAQAQGARHRGQPTGSFGDISATSFYPIKNLGALGDGGATTTNDQKLDSAVRMLRNYGLSKPYEYELPGGNSRLDELQAAFLNVKLDFLDEWNKQRLHIARIYIAELRGVGDLIAPLFYDESSHVFHRFVIRTSRRDSLKKFLGENGVETMVHYPVPPHLQPAYAGLRYRRGAFPVAELLANTSLSLPIWPGMTYQQVDRVVSLMKKFWN